MHVHGSPHGPIAISREQRDAIRADLLTHLTAIGDVYIMIEQGDYATAQRLRREFEEDLRLLDDLGWGEDDPGESFELTMPLDELAHAVRRLHDRSSEALRAYTRRDTTAEELAASDAVACSAYRMVFGRLAELLGASGDEPDVGAEDE